MRQRGNPQLEDGHTRIANELLEALTRYPFSGGELKVLLAIIRLTYGWNRTRRPIRQTTLVQMTGLRLRQIKRILTALRQQGVLFRDRTTQPHTFCLNKAYVGWRDWPPDTVDRLLKRGCELSPQGVINVPVAGDTRVPPLLSIKERKEKEEKERTYEPAVHNLFQHFQQALNRPLTPDEEQLIHHLHELSADQAHALLEQCVQAMRGRSQPTGG